MIFYDVITMLFTFVVTNFVFIIDLRLVMWLEG